AEDGIRDYKVTGVQTCALPILDQRVVVELRIEGEDRKLEPVLARGLAVAAAGVAPGLAEHRLDVVDEMQLPLDREVLDRDLRGRSEERRVGKEWRCGWWRGC